jgi:hypothetical protein
MIALKEFIDEGVQAMQRKPQDDRRREQKEPSLSKGIKIHLDLVKQRGRDNGVEYDHTDGKKSKCRDKRGNNEIATKLG